MVLAVDDIHIDAAHLMRLRKTLDRFLEREIPPEDLVALVSDGFTPGPGVDSRAGLDIAGTGRGAERRAAPRADL